MDYKKISARLQGFRTWIPRFFYLIDSNLKEIVNEDMENQKYQCTYHNIHSNIFLNWLLINDKSFRSIFYFRLKKHKIAWILSRIFLPNTKNIEISGKISGGLCIFHGHGTVIACYKAGRNLQVWQNVTIGRNPKTEVGGIDTPTIGNNVKIYTNSVVIGNIIIGDNVNIGAGSVVLKSIPSDCTVVGNPAYIVRRNGIRVKEKL